MVSQFVTHCVVRLSHWRNHFFSHNLTVVYTPATDSDRLGHQLYWWLIFLVGVIFGQFYNIQQEKTFKEWGLTTMSDYMDYLFWQTFCKCCHFGYPT
jgi:hypothetical protein